MMKLSSIFLLLLLVSCGGGGGGSHEDVRRPSRNPLRSPDLSLETESIRTLWNDLHADEGSAWNSKGDSNKTRLEKGILIGRALVKENYSFDDSELRIVSDNFLKASLSSRTPDFSKIALTISKRKKNENK